MINNHCFSGNTRTFLHFTHVGGMQAGKYGSFLLVHADVIYSITAASWRLESQRSMTKDCYMAMQNDYAIAILLLSPYHAGCRFEA